jgi:TonB family protein
MFRKLIESEARAPRRPGWIFTSAGAHAMLIGLATALTLHQSPARVERVMLEELVFTVPREPVPVLPQPETGTGVPSWLAPREIPVTIPDIPEVPFPIDAPLRLAPTDILGPGLPGDHGLRPAPPGTHVYPERLVDKAVVARADNPQPEYPLALRASHVEGEVVVQFVVDINGRVELRSIVIVRATHPLFAESVRRWLSRTRYSPAEIESGPVRQLVQQVVGFTLRP